MIGVAINLRDISHTSWETGSVDASPGNNAIDTENTIPSQAAHDSSDIKLGCSIYGRALSINISHDTAHKAGTL